MASKQMATFRSAKVARVITSFDTVRAARAACSPQFRICVVRMSSGSVGFARSPIHSSSQRCSKLDHILYLTGLARTHPHP